MSVREAAERLNRYLEDRVVTAADYEDCEGDIQCVATAYLAEHPADEGKPITDAWLREIGFADGNMPGDLTLSPVVRGIAVFPAFTADFCGPEADNQYDEHLFIAWLERNRSWLPW